MKFTIERDVLAAAMSSIMPIIEKSSPIAILSTVRLVASESGTLEITGTNMTAETRRGCPAQITAPGMLCVAADKIAALSNSLPTGSQIDFEAKGGKLIARYGKGRASLVTLSADDFPLLTFDAEKAATLSIAAGELRRLLSMTLSSVYVGPGRDGLAGVHLHTERASLIAVSTDGKMMTIGQSTLASAVEFSGITLPRESVVALIGALPDDKNEATVSLTDRLVRIATGSLTLTTKVIDIPFVEYRRVLPIPTETPIRLDALALKEVAARAQALTEAMDGTSLRPRAFAIKVNGGGEAQIEAGSEADQKLDETIDAEYAGPEVRVGLSTRNVLDAIESLGGEGQLILHVRDEASPVLFQRDGNPAESVTVMPFRV